MKDKPVTAVLPPTQSRSEERFTTGQVLAGHAVPEARTRPAAPAAKGFALAWNNFWFQAVDSLALHVVRILTGLLLLSWLLAFAGRIEEMFSTQHGWIDQKAIVELSRLSTEVHQTPNWSLLYLCDSVGGAAVLYWGTIGVIGLFTLGLATRITSILTWILTASFVNFMSRCLTPWEIELLVMPAFYLMVGYVLLGQFNRKLSLPERILGSWDTFVLYPLIGALNRQRERPAEPRVLSYAANVSLRLLQVNFALFVVTVFFSKLQVGDWWSGMALWYPLHQPFDTVPAALHSEGYAFMWRILMYTITTYVLMGWQLTFPLWAWRPRFRLLLVAGAWFAWVGTTWIYRDPTLGFFYFVGCLSFVPSEDWRRLRGLLAMSNKRLAISNKQPA